MFSVSSSLTTLLRTRSRDLIYVYEIYAFDYDPFPGGSALSFDPRSAIELFAGQNISFSTGTGPVSYRREVLEGPSIQKHIGKQFDSASIKFSNIDRYMAAFVLNTKIHGMRLVIRAIPRSAPITGSPGDPGAFIDSFIRFTGRIDKPDSFNRATGTITATQDIGTISAQIPPGQLTPPCPLKFKGLDCLGPETLDQKTATYKAAKVCNKSFQQCTDYSNTEFFQGTRIVQITSSFVNKSNQSFFRKLFNITTFGLFFKRKKTTVSDSIHDGTPYGTPISIILGRWQKTLLALQYQDVGTSVRFLMSACRGTIKDFLNIRNDSTPAFSQPQSVVKHKGEYGGVGTQTQDTVFPEQGFFSKLAYITGYCTGTNIITEDAAPELTAMIAGSVVKVAYPIAENGSGRITNVFASYQNGSECTDNPVDQAFYVITDPALLSVPELLMAQKESCRTSAYTTGAIKDVSNAERCLLPNTETTRAGVNYKRYNSTGLIGALSFFGVGGDFLINIQKPQGIFNREAKYEFYNPASPPTGLTLKTFYRKRYTSNIEAKEQKKAIDFLYDTLFPTFRGFLKWDSFGRIVIDCERPAEHTYLRANAVSTATTIKVLDVTPWKPLDGLLLDPDPLRGKVLLGVGKLTSEVRPVSASSYTADGDAITLSASKVGGGLTVTASGATLSGGSSSVPSSGSVNIDGTLAVGDSATITIDGFAITIIATQEDVDAAIDYLTLACQLIYAINAEPILNQYVEASRGNAMSGTDVLIYSKMGVLTVPALVENHYAQLADPTVAPVLASSAGALAAGAYLVSYAYRNANGNTNISPITAITLTASKKIDVTGIALPAGATSIDWFVSVEANSGTMQLVLNNNGTGFSINALPTSTALDVPKLNTTGEEMMRVMYSDAQRALAYADTLRATHLDGSFSWPEGSKQSTVNQVKTKYHEAIQDFAEQPLVVNDERHQEQTGQVNSVDLDLSAVDNYNQASRLCNGYLAKVRDADFFFKWGSAGEPLLLEIGDVVCLSDDSGSWRNVPVRIEDVEYDNEFKASFTCRLYSTSQFDDTVLQTEVPLPSALINFENGPPNISFNTVDFPPDGLVQSTDGTAGITSIRGGAIFGASIYGQFARAKLIKRAGVTVSEQVGILTPDSNLKAVFEFVASADGLYTVELEVCDLQNFCNTTKPTASIVIGFGSLFGLAGESGYLLLTEGSDILEVEH